MSGPHGDRVGPFWGEIEPVCVAGCRACRSAATFKGLIGFHGVVLSGFKIWALGGKNDGLTALGLKSGGLQRVLEPGLLLARTFSALNPDLAS